MRSFIEIRRHSMRVSPAVHLSQSGVRLARRVGDSLGRFQKVITSTLPRAVETAVAMGFAVESTEELLSSLPGGVEQQVSYPQSFARYAAAVGSGGPAAQFAGRLADFHNTMAASLSEGAAALVIDHGGVLELSVVGCLPGWDFEPWGGPAGYCEGARLTWKDGAFVEAELLRVPEMIEP